jgi:hypothetical protein
MIHVANSWSIPSGCAAAFPNAGGYDCYATWDEVPANLKPDPVAQAKADLESSIVAQVQASLDAFAKAVAVDAQGRIHGGYDDVNSISKYQNLTDAQIAAMPSDKQAQVALFRADCQYLAGATALTWATLYSLLAQVQAGNWPTTGAAKTPTGFADVQPSLPVLAW